MSITWASFVLVFCFFIAIIESVRRGFLETRFSILWLLTCVAMGFLSFSPLALESISGFLHVYYAPSVLFLFGLLFSVLLIFYLTRLISDLNHKVVSLTQAHALLEEEIAELKARKEG